MVLWIYHILLAGHTKEIEKQKSGQQLRPLKRDNQAQLIWKVIEGGYM